MGVFSKMLFHLIFNIFVVRPFFPFIFYFCPIKVESGARSLSLKTQLLASFGQESLTTMSLDRLPRTGYERQQSL